MNEKIKLKSKVFCCFGLRGTGKSTLVNSIATKYGKKAFLYDTLNESPTQSTYYSYTPVKRNSVAELERIVQLITPGDNSSSRKLPYSMFIIDEANRFCPTKPHPLPPIIADLNDQCRHYKLSVGFVARRPCQLNQDITELADYLFIFHLTGRRDIAYLNDISRDLGDAVSRLKGYNFVVVYPSREYQTVRAITPGQFWVERAERLTR